MDQPNKFFNFLMPFMLYKELRLLSVETDNSVAEIVRQAISEFLSRIEKGK